MKARWKGVAMLGWVAFLVLAYCSSPGIDVDVRVDWSAGDEAVAADGAADDISSEPVGDGQLSVVDAEGRLVGIVVARTHRLLEHNELFDAVQVYHPGARLFFSARMATAEILRPGKVFFSGSNCNGTPALRALCPDCPSGYDLAFAYKGTWYRVPGGVMRESFKYASYVAEEADAQCTGHGNSSTHVYPLETLQPHQQLASFAPPLRFVWGP